MTKQFTPADRETVLDLTRGLSHIYDARPCGPGVYAIHRADDGDVNDYTDLVERHGWYVDKYKPHDNGDKAILMPITEVNTDD